MFAPADQASADGSSDLLARVQRRMLVRDDEDLAIEQLPAAGRANDPELDDSRVRPTELPQERAAALAEPPAAATPSRVRELGGRIEQLQAQLEGLPTRQLERIEHFDERALTLSSRRERLAKQLAQLPVPGRRFGREHDPFAVERAHLTSALEAHDRELQAVVTHRTDLEQELGDPAEIRAERDGLERAIRQTGRELRMVQDELAERELRVPMPRPERRGEQRDCEPAREAIGHAYRSPSRHLDEADIEIEP